MPEDWHEYSSMENIKLLWTSDYHIELNVKKTLSSLDFYLCIRIPWLKSTWI